MSIKKTITVALASGLLATSSQAITIFGLGAGGQLYSFDSSAPGTVTPVGAATGFVDIDFRGSNGKLYGLNGNGSFGTINTGTGQVATLVNPLSSLTGTVSGFDFNPAADRMRIATGGTTNYRMVPDGISTATAGTVISDGTFAVPLNVTLLDVAYTNPTNGIAGTSLFSIGSDGNLYSHPASGAPQFNTLALVGATGISFSGNIGFDIGPDNMGYVVDGTNFYTLNLTTGAASLSGTLGVSLNSIAAVPEPSSILLGSLAGLGLLRRRRNA